jgi:UDP-GlcNAc:undecaprenyl-phosphate GlcNAc-1-phosphate transferase
VVILWSWTALLSAFVLYPAYTGKGDAIVPLAIAGLCLFLFTVLSPAWRHGNGDSEDAGPQGEAADPAEDAVAESPRDLQPYDPIA